MPHTLFILLHKTISKTSGVQLASKIKWSKNTNIKPGNSQGIQNLEIFRVWNCPFSYSVLMANF